MGGNGTMAYARPEFHINNFTHCCKSLD